MINFGAVPIGAVLPVFFDTFAGSTGASVTITGLAVTDIEIYKGTSMTQRASDNGYALIDTDGIDLDGVTGIHGFSIDTGDNTDAGFYASGSFYTVVVSAVTVDSQTVNFVAATFRCVTAEGVAGQPKVDTAAFGGTAGTFSGGRPEVNASHIAGSAVSTSTAQIGVNVVNFGGSAGTFASGRPEVNTTHAAGTAWGSGAITAGSIASDAITAAKIADGAIDLATFAADAKALMGVIAFGTAQSVTGTTIRLASAETFADDELIGATVIIRSATTGAGQARVITDYVSATDTATVDTWTTTPTGTITYVVIATAQASTSAPIAANVTQWNGSAVATPAVSGVPKVDVTHNAGTAITAASGVQEVKVASIAANAITATSIASDAITDAKVASDVTIASVTGAVGSVTGNVGGNVTGSVGSVVGAVGSVTGNVGGNVVGSVGSVTGAVGSVTGAVGSVTGNVGGNVVGSVGSVTGAVGSVTAGVTVTTNNDKTGYRLSATGVDDIWDEATSGHTTAGTTGKALTDAGSAGDPWSTAVPGAYAAGTAGYLIGTYVDAPISTVDTVVDAIKAKTDSLTFTVAGKVDANIKSVNNVTVTGTGAVGDEWGP